MTEQEKKWFWMMDWCRQKGFHPSSAWNSAEEAWLKHLYSSYDPNFPIEDQINKYSELKELDNCHCGEKRNARKSLFFKDGRLHWCLEWICRKHSSHSENTTEPF